MRRLGVTQFKAAPEQWKNKQKTADAMMGAFEKEFGGEEPKQKESAKRKHKDVSEKENKEKKPKKEKKVKKEKREKKEKGA